MARMLLPVLAALLAVAATPFAAALQVSQLTGRRQSGTRVSLQSTSEQLADVRFHAGVRKFHSYSYVSHQAKKNSISYQKKTGTVVDVSHQKRVQHKTPRHSDLTLDQCTEFVGLVKQAPAHDQTPQSLLHACREYDHEFLECEAQKAPYPVGFGVF
jgi:hypothetical protein